MTGRDFSAQSPAQGSFVQAPRFATNGVLRRGPRIKKKLGRSGIILHSGRIYHLRQNKEILGPDMTPGKRFEVAGFESRGYLAFIVSDLDRKNNLQIAKNLAPLVAGFLNSVNG